MNPFKGLIELIRGLRITGKHLGRHAITLQYPEERWTMPERSRGIVVLLSDKDTGELNCTACVLCERACPTGAIRIDAPKDEKKKRHLKNFNIDFGICCFCGLCEEACNFSAIKMAPKYEFSTHIKEDLLWDVKKLQQVGRDVPYIDTRKKKKEAAAGPGEAKPVAGPAAAAAAEGKPAAPATDRPAQPDKEEEANAVPAAAPASQSDAKPEPAANVTEASDEKSEAEHIKKSEAPPAPAQTDLLHDKEPDSDSEEQS